MDTKFEVHFDILHQGKNCKTLLRRVDALIKFHSSIIALVPTLKHLMHSDWQKLVLQLGLQRQIRVLC